MPPKRKGPKVIGISQFPKDGRVYVAKPQPRGPSAKSVGLPYVAPIASPYRKKYFK